MSAARSGRAWTDGGRHIFGPQRHTLTCVLWAGSDFVDLAVCVALNLYIYIVSLSTSSRAQAQVYSSSTAVAPP